MISLREENDALRRKCSELESSLASVKPNQEEPRTRSLPDLDAIANRILKNLKLGTQAPGYKAARKALDLFIGDLTHE